MFLLDGAGTFCADTKEIWSFVGVIVTIFKIVIPVIIIILGSVDLGKAVVASKEDDIKKSATILIKRIAVAIVIFFIPTIVRALFNLFSGGSEAMKDASVCIECVTKGKC